MAVFGKFSDIAPVNTDTFHVAYNNYASIIDIKGAPRLIRLRRFLCL